MIFTLVLGVVGVGLGAPAQGVPGQVRIDAVREWNGLALNAVRLTRASDSDSARVYAMLNVALYDTVNGLAGARQRTHAVVPESGPAGADVQAAGVAAAHSVLSTLDPDRAGVYDSHLSADLAQLRPGRPRDLGVAWGQHVGQAVVAARADDGSRPVQIQPAGSGPGVFRADWSGVQFGQARPFAVADAGVFVPGPPPALDSLDYAAALADVSVVGNAALPDPAKRATFQFWSLPAGSVQPPGEWVKIALEVSDARTLPLDDSTRLLALLSMALFDTAIVTTRTKSTYRHWRPATAIQEADTDGNPLTQADPGWAPRAGAVGGTPEYVSGHSSFSAAGATVLAGFFCSDHISFTHVTDTAPGNVARTYPSFTAAAAEAGRSRVFGGQHFEFSNQAGLTIGRGVAAEVLTTHLLHRSGPTHLGDCPL
jgi:membrane-associated phospholipid phosphatase